MSEIIEVGHLLRSNVQRSQTFIGKKVIATRILNALLIFVWLLLSRE
jgi:hypothetical protein